MSKQKYFEMVDKKKEIRKAMNELHKQWDEIAFEGTHEDMANHEAKCSTLNAEMKKLEAEMSAARLKFTVEELRDMKAEYEAR